MACIGIFLEFRVSLGSGRVGNSHFSPKAQTTFLLEQEVDLIKKVEMESGPNSRPYGGVGNDTLAWKY